MLLFWPIRYKSSIAIWNIQKKKCTINKMVLWSLHSGLKFPIQQMIVSNMSRTTCKRFDLKVIKESWHYFPSIKLLLVSKNIFLSLKVDLLSIVLQIWFKVYSYHSTAKEFSKYFFVLFVSLSRTKEYNTPDTFSNSNHKRRLVGVC